MFAVNLYLSTDSITQKKGDKCTHILYHTNMRKLKGGNSNKISYINKVVD